MRTTIGKLPWWWAVPAIIAGLAIGWWHPGEKSGVTAAVEGRLLDLRHVVRGPIAPPDEFAIVAIDDKTYRRLRFPLPRAYLAAAIDRLTDAGAKVLAIDLLLADQEATTGTEGISDGDRLLEAALKRHGHVILAASQLPDTQPDPQLVRQNMFGLVQAPARPISPVGFQLPVTDLAKLSALAHVNLPPDADYSIRRIFMAMPIGEGDYIPAMPLEVVRLLRDLPRSDMTLTVGESVSLGSQVIAIGDENSIAINHYGGQGTIPTYSLVDVVDGVVPAERFAGRAVFIGATALGSPDTFLSPFAPRQPGVEILATTAANIAHDQYLRRAPSTFVIDLIFSVTLAILAFLAANRLSLMIAVGATIALWTAAFLGGQFAFSSLYLWLDATTYALSLFSVGLITFSARIVQQRMISGQLQSERDNLARYHSPLLTEFLAEQQEPSFSHRPQEAAVMFVDVAGFTRRAERLGPAATVDFLRDLHGRIERAASSSSSWAMAR